MLLEYENSDNYASKCNLSVLESRKKDRCCPAQCFGLDWVNRRGEYFAALICHASLKKMLICPSLVIYYFFQAFLRRFAKEE